jgi:carboxylesterase
MVHGAGGQPWDDAGVAGSGSTSARAVRAGAEPFRASGGPVGVLFCHGFTGSPASLRPWAQAVADAGHSVELPLLPGHGTQWKDLATTRWDDWFGAVEQALLELSTRCREVFVFGLSMGGTLTLALAERHPDQIAGIVLVNPIVLSRNRAMVALPLMRHVVPSLPGIVNDVKRPGQDEVGYERMPLQALHSLSLAWPRVRDGLPSLTLPVLLLHSAVDHVVEPENSTYVVAHLGSTDVTEVELPDSYHVATLDNDLPTIIDRSLAFVERVAGP